MVAGKAQLTEEHELESVGVSVQDHRFGKTRAKLYDLAGQVDYYGLHQLFLTERALYVSVWDASKFLGQTQVFRLVIAVHVFQIINLKLKRSNPSSPIPSCPFRDTRCAFTCLSEMACPVRTVGLFRLEERSQKRTRERGYEVASYVSIMVLGCSLSVRRKSDFCEWYVIAHGYAQVR